MLLHTGVKAWLPWVLWPCWWLSEVWAPGGLGGSSPQRLRSSCNHKHTHTWKVRALLCARFTCHCSSVMETLFVFTPRVAALHSGGRGMCRSFNQEQPEVYTSVTQLHAEEEQEAQSSLVAIMRLWWRPDGGQEVTAVMAETEESLYHSSLHAISRKKFL